MKDAARIPEHGTYGDASGGPVNNAADGLNLSLFGICGAVVQPEFSGRLLRASSIVLCSLVRESRRFSVNEKYTYITELSETVVSAAGMDGDTSAPSL